MIDLPEKSQANAWKSNSNAWESHLHRDPLVSSHVEDIVWLDKSVENEKDKLDLKPSVDFVSQNISSYKIWLSTLRIKEKTPNHWKWDKLSWNWIWLIVRPQLSFEDCLHILDRMPEVLIDLSKLTSIDYNTFSTWKNLLPIPQFDEKWRFNWWAVLIEPANFPRIANLPSEFFERQRRVYKKVNEVVSESDHPSRVLVWVTIPDGDNWYKILPTPIPKSVSKDGEAVFHYQTHVFLHEFFHTVEFWMRNAESRTKIILEWEDWKKYSLEDWYREFERIILSSEPISIYSSVYKNDLSEEKKGTEQYSHAIGEESSEVFAWYILGIIQNHNWETDFKKHAWKKWELMDYLCKSKILNNL